MKAARRPPPSTAAQKCGLWEARLLTALSGRRDPWLVPLEGSAKWSGRTGISLREPGRRVRAAVPNCWERAREEHWDCKDRTTHVWPRQPLELGRGVLLSTRQTKGKERPRWAWKWRGGTAFLIPCSLREPCSLTDNCGLWASGWTG